MHIFLFFLVFLVLLAFAGAGLVKWASSDNMWEEKNRFLERKEVLRRRENVRMLLRQKVESHKTLQENWGPSFAPTVVIRKVGHKMPKPELELVPAIHLVLQPA